MRNWSYRLFFERSLSRFIMHFRCFNKALREQKKEPCRKRTASGLTRKTSTGRQAGTLQPKPVIRFCMVFCFSDEGFVVPGCRRIAGYAPKDGTTRHRQKTKTGKKCRRDKCNSGRTFECPIGVQPTIGALKKWTDSFSTLPHIHAWPLCPPVLCGKSFWAFSRQTLFLC